LFFTLFIPIAEMFMLGYAIDTNVRHVRTVVVDFAGTQESRELVQRFENSQDFSVVMRCFSEEQANRAIVAGKAQVGIILGLVLSLALLAKFGPAYLSAHKFMPAGLMTILSAIGLVLTVLALIKK